MVRFIHCVNRVNNYNCVVCGISMKFFQLKYREILFLAINQSEHRHLARWQLCFGVSSQWIVVCLWHSSKSMAQNASKWNPMDLHICRKTEKFQSRSQIVVVSCTSSETSIYLGIATNIQGWFCKTSKHWKFQQLWQIFLCKMLSI